MVGASVWRIKTESDYHAAIANLIELMTDIEITSIDANFCREYKDKLIHYPLHRPKTRHIKNAEVNEIINSKTIYPKISTTTVNNQIRKGTLFSIG
ncbi:hypothetical protein GCM10017161_28430 [Thalassotalea marina]|uniref:Uncharacterized protein n=2 Tax=Thalassotalea marina TaxID=1673741 RepID=A0A919EN75_9GAMM|nr:hypothetical protein GCM10017161_28430 [Thalassotalea marina]